MSVRASPAGAFCLLLRGSFRIYGPLSAGGGYEISIDVIGHIEFAIGIARGSTGKARDDGMPKPLVPMVAPEPGKPIVEMTAGFVEVQAGQQAVMVSQHFVGEHVAVIGTMANRSDARKCQMTSLVEMPGPGRQAIHARLSMRAIFVRGGGAWLIWNMPVMALDMARHGTVPNVSQCK